MEGEFSKKIHFKNEMEVTKKNLRKMLFLPNETLYDALIDGRRKRPSNQNQKIWPFWPNFDQIHHSAALNV